jgi:hypothetical protein
MSEMQSFKLVSGLNTTPLVMFGPTTYKTDIDPFVAAVNLKQQAPLMVFQEHPDMNNTHWLTDVPVYGCRKYRVGATPVLCSGSTMGSREGILDYLSVMVVSRSD